MSLFKKFLHASETRNTHQKTHCLRREALRRKENPVVYQVKQKLRGHQDPKYSQMNDEEMTREAIHLTDTESLKAFFSDLTHSPIQSVMEEVHNSDDDIPTQSGHYQQKHLERVGQLTLKLHLSLPDQTPSQIVRLGVALLKIPYGVLHTALEIGDTSNPNISYMLEYSESSLVQPRRKSLIEASVLEATIPMGGRKLELQAPWPKEDRAAERAVRERAANIKTGVRVVDEYFQAEHTPARPRSVCVPSKYNRPKRRTISTPCATEYSKTTGKDSASERVIERNLLGSSSLPLLDIVTGSGSAHTSTHSEASRLPPTLQASQNLEQTLDSREDLTPFMQLSLSKILVIDKLVKIIVKYNKSYYYHSITRNGQTFIIEVLQSLGVWENFKLGDRLKGYIDNLTKGRQEVYKSHKAVNDRVRYLYSSGEIEETTYDEARYLRSLYTIFHLEEASGSTDHTPHVCSDQNCMLKDLQEHLDKKRPEGATALQSPVHYL